MTWLLSLLGIGGIGAALFLVPGLAASALKALTALLDNPWQVALIVALCLSAWLWWGKREAFDQRDAARAQVAAWKDANAKATAWAVAEKRAKEQSADQAKDQANAVLKPSLAAGQAATDRYVRDNRCVRVAASEGRLERADMSGAVQPAGQPSSSTEQADVAVTGSDLAACTSAVLTLDNAYTWAQDMVARGLAE